MESVYVLLMKVTYKMTNCDKNQIYLLDRNWCELQISLDGKDHSAVSPWDLYGIPTSRIIHQCDSDLLE